MVKNVLCSLIIFHIICSYQVNAQQQTNIQPGGVTGSEVWFMATDSIFSNGNFENFSETSIELTHYGQYDKGLLNFNPAINLEPYPFEINYTSGLEDSKNRTIFIVSESFDTAESLPHASTSFNDFVPQAYLDSLSRNTYVIETQQGFASNLVATFDQYQSANVHYYSWSQYYLDKKFKSYGLEGESNFHFFKLTDFDAFAMDTGYFDGLITEFITFDRAVTENERERIESYLALKYGITKWHNTHYRDSDNKIFWNKSNNELFGNLIFGIGRDDITGQHQLISESAHNKDFLVAAAYQILEDNSIAKDTFSIVNQNYLVFGDNGIPGLKDPNQQNLIQLKKVWLAQRTGDSISEVPMHFRVDITDIFSDYLEAIKRERVKIWMLHDRFVNNSYVSDFDNGNVEYYQAFDLEITDRVYAHFNEVYFDTDENHFDQYTFAVGPEMLVQVRYSQWQCVGQCFDIEILITGGEFPYTVTLVDENDNPVVVTLDAELTEINEQYTYVANVCGDLEYTVQVYDDHNTYAEYTFYVEALNYTLDLGPDLFFSANETGFLLDAGQGISDPNATYQWFFNDEVIAHYESTLWVTVAGTYKVIVTTSDMACQLEDEITISHQLSGTIQYHFLCSEEQSELIVEVTDGIPPYTTHILGDELDVTYVHEGNTTIVGIPSAEYLVTVSDSAGSSFQELINLGNYQPPVLSLGPDQVLSESQPSVVLDATAPFGNNSNHIYEWYRNGLLMSETSSSITVFLPGEYSVIAIDTSENCNEEASILITHELDVTVLWDGDCEAYNNSLNVQVDFGFPLYSITLTGIQYSYEEEFEGDFIIYDIPNGTYDIVITDAYGGIYEDTFTFMGLHLDIYSQLIDVCMSCGGSCELNYTTCTTGIPFFDGSCYPNPTFFEIDASLLVLSGQNVSYEWYLWDNLISTSPQIFFAPSHDCYDLYPINEDLCGNYPLYTVVLTDLDTGCIVEQKFASKSLCFTLNNEPVPPLNYNTYIYPNPGLSDATFYYTINKSNAAVFNGTVELYSVTGALIQKKSIQGQSTYTLPFSLVASGTYFVRTTTNDGTVTVDRVIIK